MFRFYPTNTILWSETSEIDMVPVKNSAMNVSIKTPRWSDSIGSDENFVHYGSLYHCICLLYISHLVLSNAGSEMGNGHFVGSFMVLLDGASCSIMGRCHLSMIPMEPYQLSGELMECKTPSKSS